MSNKGMAPLYEELKNADTKDTEDLIKALSKMMESDKNLNMKTHIVEPYSSSMLQLSGEYLKSIHLKESAKLVLDFDRLLKEHWVSYNRLGRNEYFGAISETLKALKRTISDRLTGQNIDNRK